MKRAHVLVVEDDPAIRVMLDVMLELGGYAVTATDSALGAMDIVRHLHPSAIVLDLALPNRSGASLLAELKADPRTAAVPVVIVSAFADLLSARRLAMADAIIAKPFSPESLLQAVRRACGAGREAGARPAWAVRTGETPLS